MKTITKFIFGFPLALACGSVAFAQVPIPPVTPADSAAKAAAQGAAPVGAVDQMVEFDSGSRWHLTVNAIDKFGLVITGASFQKSLGSRFIYVLFDGRLGEIFVPYHEGSPRYYDIAQFDWHPLTLTPAQFPRRQIIGGGKICKETRDYLAWMEADFHVNNPPLRTSRVRYGQEVVYFSVLGAGNYAYIMEWTFRDDGTILARAGSTGPKLGAPGDPSGHMHNFTWRLDIDLNGAGGDSARLTSHREIFALGQDSTATDGAQLISVEQGLLWDPKKFNTLQIQDSTLENGNERPTSYELVPLRSGTARHSEPFTKKDFWVTRYDPQQSLLAKDLPNYVAQRQSTDNQDIVVWYTGSEHHEIHSRDEDFNTVPVLWTGFQLVPNNLFDHTPFYPNP
jgi:Cu2+-containing amine oxidase